MARRGSPLLAFAAGAGSGYLDQQRQNELDAERREDRAMRKQEFDARMDEVGQVKQQRIALSEASRPAVVNESAVNLDMGDGPKLYQDAGVANSDLRQARSMGLSDVQAPQQTFAVNGKSYGDRPSADAAVTAYNTPDAKRGRQADALDAAGKPGEAISLANAALTQKQNGIKFTQDQADYARKLKREGVPEAARAFHAGNVEGLKTYFNSTGQFKFDGEPEITPAPRRLSGVKDPVMSYDGKFRIIGPDGTITEKTINSLDALKELMPFDKFLASEREGTKAETAATLAQVALMNASGKTPPGYRKTSDGNLEAIPGGPAAQKAATAASGKPMPASAAKGLLENQTNLRRAQMALALVNGETVDGAVGDKSATGLKGMLPNQILNRVDPAGVDTRAAIADLGSLVIHDRSGAAVTASEFPRLAPFIPTEKDDAETVKKKLTQFTKNYQSVMDDASNFYRASGYNVPSEVLKNAQGNAPKPKNAASTSQDQMPRVTSAADAMKLPPGTVFVDPNGVTRRRP